MNPYAFLVPKSVGSSGHITQAPDPSSHIKILPDVIANIAQRRSPFLAKPAQEPQQGFCLPLFADPQQACATLINLADQSQVLVTSLPLDLINSDRLDSRESLVLTALRRSRFHLLRDLAQGLLASLPGSEDLT